jgi:hypothetical protein
MWRNIYGKTQVRSRIDLLISAEAELVGVSMQITYEVPDFNEQQLSRKKAPVRKSVHGRGRWFMPGR